MFLRILIVSVFLSILPFACLLSANNGTLVYNSEKSTYTDSLTGIEFVLVKGACFEMGDIFGDGDKDEQPAHRVCLDDFFMGKYEITQGQWQQIMGVNPAYHQKGSNYPVEVVSGYEAGTFLKKLNEKTKGKFRLPTEAEWEYACRSGGKKVRYGTQNDIVSNSTANLETAADGFEGTAPVGSFPPNQLGLYDMSGNVSEWTSDWLDIEYYKRSPVKNPKGSLRNQSRALVRRGGSWQNKKRFLRCSIRNWHFPGYHLIDLGFRIVADVN